MNDRNGQLYRIFSSIENLESMCKERSTDLKMAINYSAMQFNPNVNLKLGLEKKDQVKCGDVGYIISGIKEAKEVKVGDTITHVERPCEEAIHGFEDVKPMVWAGIYPVDTDEYEELRNSMEKLQLNDASLVFQPEASAALGFGFRCGFLGLLHMEIIQERLEREYNQSLINTVPNVEYKVTKTNKEILVVDNPALMPDASPLRTSTGSKRSRISSASSALSSETRTLTTARSPCSSLR